MKLNKLRKIIIESTIWFVLIVFFVFMTVHLVDEKFINKPKHIIKFKDVNGLIVGSPVYYAGVNIGHVSDIDLLENEAVVTFKLDRKDITLPKGTYANIEFKGLAGSKSIELFRTPYESQEITSTETIRFSTVINAYNTFMETIISISDFVMVVVKETDEKDAKKLLKTTRNILSNVQKKSEKVTVQLDENVSSFTKGLHEAKENLAKFLGFKPAEDLSLDLEAVSKKVDEFNEKIPLSTKIKAFIKGFLPKTQKAKKEACKLSTQKKEEFKKVLDKVDDMNCSIYKFSKSAEQKYNKDSIEAVKCKVEEIKQQVIEMNKNMRVEDGNCN